MKHYHSKRSTTLKSVQTAGSCRCTTLEWKIAFVQFSSVQFSLLIPWSSYIMTEW